MDMDTTKKAPDWDRQVIEHAIGIGINSGNRGVVAAASEQAVARKFARWQRDKLRERDALERVKQAIHDIECNCGEKHEGRANPVTGLTTYSEVAQGVITALLGDD